jgi:hypothetical protein
MNKEIPPEDALGKNLSAYKFNKDGKSFLES